MKEFGIAACIVLVAVIAALASGELTVRPPSELPTSPANGRLIPLPTAQDSNFMEQVEKCFLPVTAAYGYMLRITSGYRTLTEQQQLYTQGRTVDGHIVTDTAPGLSIHNFGYAVDVADRRRAFRINWERLGRIASFCGLEQGDEGDFAHFEYRGGLTRAQFAAGLRPQPLSLPCPFMKERTQRGAPLALKDLTACGAPAF